MHISFGPEARQDKPVQMRVRVYLDDYGCTQYEPQAKYSRSWLPNNGGSTRRPSSLAWGLIHGMKLKLKDIQFVEEGRAKVNMKVMEEQEYRLSFFPFDPPVRGKRP